MSPQNLRKKPKSLKIRPHQNATYRAKGVPIRVARHEHTLRWLPFYCTSYAILFFLLIFASTFILLASQKAKADQQSGTIQLSGLVKGKPPEIAARITSPQSGSHFTDSQIEVSGTCLQDTYVELYRKDIFAGMTICSAEGTFSITITLAPGSNDIKAKTRDNYGQYGPDSAIMTLFLDIKQPSTQASSSAQIGYSKPMLIYTTPIQRGIAVGQTMTIEYEINGNEPPYAVSIDWGDGTPNLLVRYEKEGAYKSSHTYKQPGQHTVRISGIGAKGGTATIQTIVVVYASNTPITSVSKCSGSLVGSSFAEYCLPTDKFTGAIDMLWPAIVVATLMTASFWIGEKITYNQLRTKH